MEGELLFNKRGQGHSWCVIFANLLVTEAIGLAC